MHLEIYINNIYMKTLVLNNEKLSRLKNGVKKIAPRDSHLTKDDLVLRPRWEAPTVDGLPRKSQGGNPPDMYGKTHRSIMG